MLCSMQHASVVNGISETDKLIEAPQSEHMTVQEELALVGPGVTKETTFDLSTIGWATAPLQIQASAATLIEQLKQLSAFVIAGPSACSRFTGPGVGVAATANIAAP